METFVIDRVRSEEGAETVEIIIGIVVFVIFGITVFGMITNVAGNKMEDVSKCLGDSQSIITKGDGDVSKTCSSYNAGQQAGGKADYNQD